MRLHLSAKWLLIVSFALLLLLGGLTVYVSPLRGYYSMYFSPNTAFEADRVTVDLPHGTTFEDLPERLAVGGIIANQDLLADFVRLKRLQGRTLSGRYTLTRGMTTRDIANLFAGRRQTPVRLVVPSVRTPEELAGRLAAQIELDSLFILSALRDPNLAQEFQFSLQQFPAMLIPNTYEVYWDISTQALFARLHKEWGRFWTAKRREQAEAAGLSLVEVSTLASIIQEEVMQSRELPIVAGVYINRMRRNMPLQACPTAKFAAGNMAISRVLKAHTEIVSPYNTYLNLGLPPGPIRYPSIQAIEAVLNYERHDFLFFCARADFSGYHHFSRTALQHAEHARSYQRELNRRGIR